MSPPNWADVDRWGMTTIYPPDRQHVTDRSEAIRDLAREKGIERPERSVDDQPRPVNCV